MPTMNYVCSKVAYIMTDVHCSVLLFNKEQTETALSKYLFLMFYRMISTILTQSVMIGVQGGGLKSQNSQNSVVQLQLKPRLEL